MGSTTDGFEDCSEVQDQLLEVVAVHNAGGAFAARKANGTVVAWGAPAKWPQDRRKAQDLAFFMPETWRYDGKLETHMEGQVLSIT